MTVPPKRGPYRQKFPETWGKILLFLMNNGPANKYEVAKSLHTLYSTVHKAVDRLEEGGLLFPVGKRKGTTGLSVKTYDLTVPGLAFALLSWKDKVEWIGVTRSHEDLLPWVFGKWRYFVAEGGEQLAKKSLLGSLELFFSGYDWDSTYRDVREMNTKTSEKISAFFIMTPKGALTEQEHDRWNLILMKDSQLRSMAASYLRGVVDDELTGMDGWVHLLRRFGGSYPQDYIERLKHLIGVLKS